MAELNIGQHCSVKTCQRLDFLPFECSGCSGLFCLEHRSYDAHSCSQVNITHERTQLDDPTSYECDFLGCQVRELIPVNCAHCSNNYCLIHRHQPDHNCANLSERDCRMAKTQELVTTIQESYKAKGVTAPKRNIGVKSQKTAAKVALMKMKMTAVGDKRIPQADRIYLRILPPQRGVASDTSRAAVVPEGSSHALFFSSEWSVGRCVDAAASTLKLRNDNNVATAKKLRLIHPETGKVLPVETKLKSLLLEVEKPLYNGGSVIAEYVQDDCQVLENFQDYL